MSIEKLYGFNGKILKFNELLMGDVGALAPSYPTDGLVARWDFNDTLVSANSDVYPDATWTLSSNGTVGYDATYYKEGKSVKGNPGRIYTSDVSIYGVFKNQTPWTVSFFFLCDDPATHPQDPWWNGDSANVGPFARTFIGYNNAGGYWYMYRRDNTTTKSTYMTLTKTCVGNTWYHMCMRYGGTADSRLQFNIDVDSSVNATSNFDIVSASVNRNSLMAEPWGSGTRYTYIDLYYVYNRYLSDAEVAQLYNGGVGI